MIGEEERAAVLKALESPQLVHGPIVKAFEAGFANLLGEGAFATAVSSCTGGLHLAYLHLGIGPDDEVIVPAQTHVATAHAVEVTGARPVFVDCDETTGNIDTNAIEDAITERTRAICVVHYLGLPVEMDRVIQLARGHDLFVVEDCALAIGGRLDGVACGLLGDVGAFSFYPVKHITTGEGGMVVSRHEHVISSIENIKAFGYDRSPEARTMPGVYDIARLGVNYRMSEIAAAIGLEQVKKVNRFAQQRAENTAVLRSLLSEMEGVIVLDEGDDRVRHAHYCVVVVLSDEISECRPRIVADLRAQGVGTSVYYPVPLPLSKYYRSKYGAHQSAFPNALRISNQSIALPVGPHLEPDDMRVIAAELEVAINKIQT